MGARMTYTTRQQQSYSDRAVPSQTQRVLLVDDDRTLRAVLTLQLEQMGYEVTEASHGQDALEILEKHSRDIDIIILDREMPVMDGMAFIRQVKTETRYAKIPIIMATGSGQPEQISQGIEAGVFYYLVKPVNYDVLATLVSTAMREASRNRKMAAILQKQKDSFTLLSEGDFSIVTLQEAEDLSQMLANCFDDPDRVYPGVLNLMHNAIEHGNLGIGLDRKAELLATGNWNEEVNRRLLAIENANKRVTIRYQKNDNTQQVIITDQGRGFDWQRFLTLDPERAVQSNGRGIALARTQSFDALEYNPAGNSVTATVYTKRPHNAS